ncbi:hypothetical protein BJ170DRAFT_594224 [Xylariales sp. AK1849]|nr:hypothetical protein BJ170DRAFT_594224 [Xylariales sp. AK1849]
MAAHDDSCKPLNTTQYLDIPSVADISGLGVDQYRKPQDHSKKALRPNPFDSLVLGIIRKILFIPSPDKRRYHASVRLQKAFNNCVLIMVDIQFVTGLAILIGGYTSRSQLSGVYWKMVVYLAWFSCSTHLSALLFLRNYLINHPAQRIWRLLSMFILLLALLVAMVPTGHFYWDGLQYWFIDGRPEFKSDYSTMDAAPAANATCYFNADFSQVVYSSGKNAMLLSVLLLLFSFVVRLLKLHTGFFGFNIKSASSNAVSKVLSSAGFFQDLFGTSTVEERVVSNMIVAAHFTTCIWIDAFSSMASDSLIPFEVYWMIISLSWGTIKLLNVYEILRFSTIPQDHTWSFGQVLPVVLIAGPMISLLEHFFIYVLPEDSFQSLIMNHDIPQDCTVPKSSSMLSLVY